MHHIMRFLHAANLLIFAILTLSPHLALSQQLGINLAGLHDWNSELPFIDIFHLSRTWVSQETGKSWGKGPDLELDEHGWIKRLAPGCWAETCILNIQDGHYPHGTYSLLFEGKGKIAINNVGGAFTQRENRVEFSISGNEGVVWIQLKETDPADYIRNIRIYPPDFSEQDGLLRPEFLDRWNGVRAIRFMEFMAINNSDERFWQQRAKMDDATWTAHGAPVEVAVLIANSLHAAPWFCLPHQADDKYVWQFALKVKEMLHPQLPVYIEYSNETWNPIFSQTQYCRNQGLVHRLSSDPIQAGHRYVVQRSLEIFHIWEQVFGGSERLRRVIAGQAANPSVNKERLSYRKAWRQCDALAIAPYLTLNVSQNSTPPLNEVRNWTLAQLEQELTENVLKKTVIWIKNAQKTAKRYRVSLIAYEGGQHLVGLQGAENDEQLTSLFQQANHSPGMGTLYDRYLDQWLQISSDGLLCLWLSIEMWSKWGSWGLAQYYDAKPQDSPKLQAVLKRLSPERQTRNQRMNRGREPVP